MAPTTKKRTFGEMMAPINAARTTPTVQPATPTLAPQAQAAPPGIGPNAAADDTVNVEQFNEDDWYNLLHSLGTAMQKANPDIQNMLQQMSPDIDYSKEAESLRSRIAARPTRQPMDWLSAASASAGSPQRAAQVQGVQEAARGSAAQKASDLESLQENLTMGHINDLQRRGKFQEALATMLLQKGIAEAGSRTRAAEKEKLEKVKGTNAVNTVRTRAQAIADTFHFDERLRLKLLDVAGNIAIAKLQKYGQLDPVTGGFSVKPDQYDQWQDETMAEIYQQAADLRKGSTALPDSVTPPAGKTPQTNRGKAGDPLGIRGGKKE